MQAFCIQCGKQIQESSRFCRICGAEQFPAEPAVSGLGKVAPSVPTRCIPPPPQRSIEAPPPPPPPPPLPTQPAPVYLPPSAPNVAPPAAPIVCGHCATANSSSYRFCRACGVALLSSPPVPSPPSGVSAPSFAPGAVPNPPSPVQSTPHVPSTVPQPAPNGLPPALSLPPIPSGESSALPGPWWARLLGIWADVFIFEAIFFPLLLTVGSFAITMKPLASAENPGVVLLMIYGLGNGIMLPLLLFLYVVVSESIWHTTIGKCIFGLGLRSSRPGRIYPTFGQILWRETWGRFAASVILYCGYWCLFRNNKPAWSDRAAHTLVERRPFRRGLRTRWAIVACISVVVTFTAVGFQIKRESDISRRGEMDTQIKAESQSVDALKQSIDTVANRNNTTNQDMLELEQELRSGGKLIGQHADTAEGLIDQIIEDKLYFNKQDERRVLAQKRYFTIRKEWGEVRDGEGAIMLDASSNSSPDEVNLAVSRIHELETRLETLDEQANVAAKQAFPAASAQL